MNFSLLRPQAHPSPRRDLEVLFQRFGLIDKFHSDVILSIIFKIVAFFPHPTGKEIFKGWADSKGTRTRLLEFVLCAT